MFIEKAIQTLLNDRDIKRNPDLKAACENALAHLHSCTKELTNGVAVDVEGSNGSPSTPTTTKHAILPEITTSENFRMDLMFEPFALACQSKSPRLVTSSLDSIQKLVAYGHIRYDKVPGYLDSLEFDDKLVSVVANCFSGPQTDEGVQLQVLKALLTIVTSSYIRVHENSLLLSVRTCYNIYLASKNLVNQMTAKATLNQVLSYVFQTMENEVQNAESSAITSEDMNDPESSYDVVRPIVDYLVDNLHNPSFAQQEKMKSMRQKDAYLVFRSLCKLSMKPLPEGPPDPKSHELRSKILSLQLILGILQNGGPSFCNDEIYVSSIKTYLCVALSQNGVSGITEVFELSLALFISLLMKYRKNLKPQIEIFFKEICLNILEAASSSFEQKWMVIQGISTMCCDAQIVIDIYVNFDCDLSAANVFERLVDCLSKLAQGRQTIAIGATSPQLHKMRLNGLECLTSILKCMVEWSRDVYVNPHQVKVAENGVEADKEPDLGDDPSQFERVKQHKHVLEHGIRLFSHKPMKGIKYLQDNGIHDGTDKAIADFLHIESDRLDKTALGEFLGDLECKEVMYEYVDAMNFASMGFVSALRKFLEGFRLPGEAQKIDRLMEKFASRYCECNPHENVLASADAAYVLAYSIIMLTTDLHSTHVKKKMTKAEFIKNNRGINESEDLPEEFLSKIYEEIASSEIKMKSSTANLAKGVLADAKKRTQLWTRESETISQTAGALMESASSKRDTFTFAKHLEHVKPMFKLIWSPLLATYSVGLQDSEDPAITQLCIEGMKCAIRIANIFGFSMERNAFIQALARFTLLTESSKVTEMKSKNVEAIKALISVAHTDGNYLETSWLEVMKCISQLELAQLIGSNSGDSNNDLTKSLDGEASKPLNEANSQSILVAVDRIFTGSKNLNGDAIVHFFTALCKVSNSEISQSKDPRMFSLVKLVEISYYNMERIRLEWSRIWQVLGTHFNVVGCNDSQNISFFAVDSLKQLSMKFLEKGELQNFHFQKDFLRPFEFIMKNNKSSQIRDMVVRCVSQMVQSQAANIKSGWKNIFSVFSLAAGDPEQTILVMSFQTTTEIVSQLLSEVCLTMVDSFQDCVKCLSEFASNQLQIDIAMEAINLIRKCAKFVHEHVEYFSDGSSSNTDEVDSHLWVRGWFPVLFELSCIINQSKLDIRTRSLTILFDIVKQYGNSFRQNWWRDLFSVLFRIFEMVKNFPSPGHSPKHSNNHKEWMDTTCNHALYAMTDVFNEFFNELSPILLPEMLSQYKWCVEHGNEQLSKSAVSCIENLVLTNRTNLKLDTERSILEFMAELVASSNPGRAGFLSENIHVHLEILSTISRMTCSSGQNLTLAHPANDEDKQVFANECFPLLMSLVDKLLSSHAEAKKAIKAATIDGTGDMGNLPLLIKQESISYKTAMDILLELYHEKSNATNQDMIEQRILAVLNEGLKYFLQTSSKTQRDIWCDMLGLIFEQILNFPESKFKVTIPMLYPNLCDILALQTTKEFRVVLCKLLKRIGLVFNIIDTL